MRELRGLAPKTAVPVDGVARYELKYTMTEARAASVRRFFAPYVELDPYADRQGGRYPISSMYLDTADLVLHRATVEGQRDRFKLRIRAYDDDPGHPAFLEIKHRHNAVISKARSRIAKQSIRKLLAGRSDGEALCDDQNVARKDFVHLLEALQVQPTVLVRYMREPFVCPFDPRVRVTFDRQIQSLRARDVTLRVGGEGWRPVEQVRVLLELKFTGTCPAWMAEGIRQLELRRVSFSKYSNAVLNEYSQETDALR